MLWLRGKHSTSEMLQPEMQSLIAQNNSHNYGLYLRRYKNPSNLHPKKKIHKSIKKVADTTWTPPSHFLHLNFQSFLSMSPRYRVLTRFSLSTMLGFTIPRLTESTPFA